MEDADFKEQQKNRHDIAVCTHCGKHKELPLACTNCGHDTFISAVE